MIQWLLLAAAASGIASLARGRGGNPAVFGLTAVAAFIFGVMAAVPFGPESVMQLVLPWTMVAIVALVVRFILGATRAKPDSVWSCPDCDMINESSYVVCQACQRPWTE